MIYLSILLLMGLSSFQLWAIINNAGVCMFILDHINTDFYSLYLGMEFLIHRACLFSPFEDHTK